MPKISLDHRLIKLFFFFFLTLPSLFFYISSKEIINLFPGFRPRFVSLLLENPFQLFQKRPPSGPPPLSDGSKKVANAKRVAWRGVGHLSGRGGWRSSVAARLPAEASSWRHIDQLPLPHGIQVATLNYYDRPHRRHISDHQNPH